MNMKKLFLLNLPYLLFVYPFDKLAQAFRLAPGADLSGKLLSIGDGFTAALSSPWLSFQPTDLLIGIAGAVVLRMAVYLKGKNAKKYRHGIEYGSARWGTAADIAPYMDKDFFQNIPMTQTERITMASRPKQPKYARNKNILVIGGSGSGKTRFFCKPSLLQAHSSYVCTDPKGTLLPEIGTFLERKKYRIKCLNLINFRKSMRYNPLAYIRSEKDILKLVNALIMNTKGEGEKSSEDFWVKAERLYYSALIGYIWYEATEEEKNFITLLDLINASEAREDDETYQSPVDLLFSQLEEREPDHFAVKQYRKFKMAAGVVCSKRLLNQAVGKSLRTHNLKPKKGAQVIKGQLEGMLLGIGAYKDHEKYLARSLEVAATLETMVQEILTISRLETNVDFKMEHFDCAPMIHGYLREIDDLVATKELQIHLAIQSPAFINGNKLLIEKVFSNLISNAVKYSPHGASVDIILQNTNGRFLFSVENTGTHIPEDDIPKLFDAFYRMEQSRSRRTGGSGLGLYMVQRILQQHNSYCEACNTENGVKFFFTI